MEPSVAQYSHLLPGLNPDIIKNHISRLPYRYFESFEPEDVADHIRGLAALESAADVVLISKKMDEGRMACTVLAYDAPSLFSILAGIFSATGASILSGNVFTYRPAKAPGASGRRGGGASRSRRRLDPLARRKIVDDFTVVPPNGVSHRDWIKNLTESIEHAVGILAQRDRDRARRARAYVNELVAERLSESPDTQQPILSPVKLDVEVWEGQHTTLMVESDDTPMFLYTLGTALAMRGIAIEGVRIRTVQGRVQDEIDIVDAAGSPISDTGVLDRVRLSVLLTKQFTHFLGSSPDPYTALSRFEQIVDDALRLPEQGKWRELLANPRIQQDLARLLGASDFMWEDFIRQQYEALLPMLQAESRQGGYYSLDDLWLRLEQALGGGANYAEKQDRLNDFKDREVFLIDLDHILNPGVNFRMLSERLTAVAEAIVAKAAEMAFAWLKDRFGAPRTVAGLPAAYTILGLGKLGGVALGYASDIELLFVYGDNGTTDGERSIANCEFFERLVEEVRHCIRAKRDGIFDIDLRLRPFGESGPLAVSLESFCNYYGRGGPAHSYERLAMVRLRHIGGDLELGKRMERIRDEIVYFGREINPLELQELRKRQFAEKNQPGRSNAKFSLGALVDLEYDVQLLQVLHGANHPPLRTPRVHRALAVLADIGVIGDQESSQLSDAYDFFRKLINGLRMLRGSAKDLFLPEVKSQEYSHLARRMGYRRSRGLSARRQLHLDFEAFTATVRAFVEKHFGRESLPGPEVATVADLVLSDSPPVEAATRTLQTAGFSDPEKAIVNLRKLAQADEEGHFARLAILACDALSFQPDPDMALNNWERFVQVCGDTTAHFRDMLSQPKQLDILLAIFSGSQFLANSLVTNPEFMDWVTDPIRVNRERTREDIINTFAPLAETCAGNAAWLDALRVMYRRELLRVGTRDICLHAPTPEITREISAVATGIASTVLDAVWDRSVEQGALSDHRSEFCVLAFGKLGGRELNYSSDIDVLGIWAPSGKTEAGEPYSETELQTCEKILARWRDALTTHTAEGYVYRVDFRLRPYGTAGRLVLSLPALDRYYRKEAALWEIQALLKASPIAGNLAVGHQFIHGIKDVLTATHAPDKVVDSIRHLRKLAVDRVSRPGSDVLDVKNGVGGIRDIEFLVQGLQLIHAHAQPDLVCSNTIDALKALVDCHILGPDSGRSLTDDYLFLRRVEHFLQIFENLRVHAIPAGHDRQEALARRLLGPGTSRGEFLAKLNQCQRRVRAAYESLLP